MKSESTLALTSHFNPIALRKAKIAYNFGLCECNRVKIVPQNFCYVMGKAVSGLSHFVQEQVFLIVLRLKLITVVWY